MRELPVEKLEETERERPSKKREKGEKRDGRRKRKDTGIRVGRLGYDERKKNNETGSNTFVEKEDRLGRPRKVCICMKSKRETDKEKRYNPSCRKRGR